MTEQRPDERVSPFDMEPAERERWLREFDQTIAIPGWNSHVRFLLGVIDAERARAERAEADVARLREALAEVVLDAEAIFSSPLVDEKLVLSAGGLYSLRSQLPKLRALTAAADEGAANV